MSKVFPINTATACKLKWTWSTLYLNTGITRSCHRTAESLLDSDNFSDFHNTSVKLQDRMDMLRGHWPENNCTYCSEIENTGGISDRMRHLTIPHAIPPELQSNPTAVNVSPTLLEVYFNNTCNLGCLYCNAELSSSIENENRQHGPFDKNRVTLINNQSHYHDLLPDFWQWFDQGFSKLHRLHMLGGEPFYQKKELRTLFSKIRSDPNPDCEFNIITNLMIPSAVLKDHIEQLKDLLISRCLKKVDITCSIDCWGKQQEYVRWGLDLVQWEKNFQFLISQKWLTVNINQTISVLTVKTMPALLTRLTEWRRMHKIGHYFSAVSPGPSYLRPEILGGKEFYQDIEHILGLMPIGSEEDMIALEYMTGIMNTIKQASPDLDEIDSLITFLEEKDRRRGTNWRALFPFIQQWEHHVV